MAGFTFKKKVLEKTKFVRSADDNFTAGKVTTKIFQSLCNKKIRNLMFSPLSFQGAFTFIHSICSEDTAIQVGMVFELLEVNRTKSITMYNQMFADVDDPDLFMHTLVGFDATVKPSAEFQDHAENFLNVDVSVADFSKPSRTWKIFEDVIKRRLSLAGFDVKRLDMSDLYPVMIAHQSLGLITSTHLTGRLEMNLVEAGTVEHKFFGDKEVYKVEMFRGIDVLRILRLAKQEATLLELPLRNESKLMLYLVLPYTREAMENTEQQLYDIDWVSSLSQMRPEMVDFTIPKFKVFSLVDLTDAIRNQDLRYLFDPAKCSMKMVTERSVTMDFFWQLCSIDFTIVDHVSPGRTASDTGSMSSTNSKESQYSHKYQSMMKTRETFKADRPFFFVVKRLTTGNHLRTILVGKFGTNKSSGAETYVLRF